MLLSLFKAVGLLPDWLNRLPEEWIPPAAQWLDAVFSFVQNDLGLIHVTRFIAEGPLEFLLDATANLLYGKRRWPFLGPIPWAATAAAAAVVGYYLGGWRLAALAGGTFVWTAAIGQWDIAMQTMSVLLVAAPAAFAIGLLLGIAAWKYAWVDMAIKPILSVLQTMVRQREEAIVLYEQGGRDELARQEAEEIDVIQSFLPRQMSEDETAQAVSALIAEIGAESIKDMGRTMALLKQRYAGMMDFGQASAVVKTALTNR